jgi:hypothetical protein
MFLPLTLNLTQPADQTLTLTPTAACLLPLAFACTVSQGLTLTPISLLVLAVIDCIADSHLLGIGMHSAAWLCSTLGIPQPS